MLTLTEARQFLGVGQVFNIHGFLNQTAYLHFKTARQSNSGLTVVHGDSLQARWTSLWSISILRPQSSTNYSFGSPMEPNISTCPSTFHSTSMTYLPGLKNGQPPPDWPVGSLDPWMTWMVFWPGRLSGTKCLVLRLGFAWHLSTMDYYRVYIVRCFFLLHFGNSVVIASCSM